MWRFLNNISRGFKNHVHSLRPSAGLCVEEEQEVLERHEKVCPFSGRRRKSLDGDEVRACSANILNSLSVKKSPDKDNDNTTCHIGHNQGFNTGQEDGRQQKSSCHYDFWQMFSGSHRMLEALSWGSLMLFGADAEKHRYKSRLLFRVLLANHSNRTSVRSINSGINISTATVLHQDIGSTKTATAHQQDTGVKAICDAPGGVQGSTADSSLQTETLDSAMKEFEHMCTEYTATTESLLGLEAAVHGDFSAAVPHLQSSCALGNTSACFNLGLCYETGSGVARDLHKAKHYYSLAAREGHSMALYNLGLMCLQCNNYNIAQSAPALTAACACGCNPVQGLNLLEKAAELGLAQAQTFLGIHHVEQTQDLTRAVPYFTAAAAQRDVDAQYFLAICYEQGWGVEVNECRAAQLYAEAAAGGHEVAMYNLAVFNEHGLGGLPQDKSSAIDLFQKAADLGCEQAKQRLEEIRSEEAAQRLGDTKTSESSFQDCNSKIEMFRQLYLHHHQEEHRPARHRHDSLLSPSASSPNLTDHIHQDLGFFFGSQTTDITHSKTDSQSQRDSRLVGTSFHLGSDGEYDDDGGNPSQHSGGSSMDDSWESITYDVFSSLRSLHKSQSQPNFSLLDLAVQV